MGFAAPHGNGNGRIEILLPWYLLSGILGRMESVLCYYDWSHLVGRGIVRGGVRHMQCLLLWRDSPESRI